MDQKILEMFKKINSKPQSTLRVESLNVGSDSPKVLVKHVKVPTVKDSEDVSSLSEHLHVASRGSQLKPIIKQDSEFNIVNHHGRGDERDQSNEKQIYEECHNESIENPIKPYMSRDELK